MPRSELEDLIDELFIGEELVESDIPLTTSANNKLKLSSDLFTGELDEIEQDELLNHIIEGELANNGEYMDDDLLYIMEEQKNKKENPNTAELAREEIVPMEPIVFKGETFLEEEAVDFFDNIATRVDKRKNRQDLTDSGQLEIPKKHKKEKKKKRSKSKLGASDADQIPTEIHAKSDKSLEIPKKLDKQPEQSKSLDSIQTQEHSLKSSQQSPKSETNSDPIHDSSGSDKNSKKTNLKKTLISKALKVVGSSQSKKEKPVIEDQEDYKGLVISIQQIALRSMTLQAQANEKRKQAHALLVTMDRLNDDKKKQIFLEKFDELNKEITDIEILISGLEHTIESFRHHKKVEDNILENTETFERLLSSRQHATSSTVVHKFNIISSFSELPKDLIAEVTKAGIPAESAERHLKEIVCILSYTHQSKHMTAPLAQLWKENQLRGKIITNYGRIKKPLEHFISERSNTPRKSPKKVYKFIKSEGKGGFGSVFFAKNTKTRKLVAIKKVLCSSPSSRLQIAAEISFLSFCSHQNIVGFEDVFLVDHEIWIVMEYLDGGSITKAFELSSFNESQMAYITDQILLGLKYLHSNDIVHRDIKGDNIMLTMDGEIRIIDMGLCMDITEFGPSHGGGTLQFMAPELITGSAATPASDMWALGITLISIANRETPFCKNSISGLFNILTNNYDINSLLHNPNKWSDEFKDFVSSCIRFDPKERPSAEALLAHEWFNLITEEADEEIVNLVNYCWAKHAAVF